MKPSILDAMVFGRPLIIYLASKEQSIEAFLV